MFLYIYLVNHIDFVSLPLNLFVYLSLYLIGCLLCLSVFLCVCLSLCLYLSSFLSVCLSAGCFVSLQPLKGSRLHDCDIS